jgi:hypothetical protein
MPSVPRATWRTTLYRIGIALGLALLAYQAWQGVVAYQQIVAQPLGAAASCSVRPLYGAGALLLYIVAYVVQMAAWWCIMSSQGATVPPGAVLEGYALAFLPRYIPGSVWGYLSRNEWLAHNHGVNYGTSNIASLVEAAMLLVTAALVGGSYLLARWWPQPLGWLALLLVGGGALWAIWQGTPRLASRWQIGKANGPETANARTTPTVANVALFLSAIALYWLFWALQGAAPVAIAHALCSGMTLGFVPATAATALAWAIGFVIIFVPAGLGVREWTLGALLVNFAPLAPGQASLLAVTSRLALIGAEVVLLLIGLRAPIAAWWRRRKQHASNIS